MTVNDVSTDLMKRNVHACKSNDAREAIRGLTKVRESNAIKSISTGNSWNLMISSFWSRDLSRFKMRRIRRRIKQKGAYYPFWKLIQLSKAWNPQGFQDTIFIHSPTALEWKALSELVMVCKAKRKDFETKFQRLGTIVPWFLTIYLCSGLKTNTYQKCEFYGR